jgi:hypothetical protein
LHIGEEEMRWTQCGFFLLSCEIGR